MKWLALFLGGLLLGCAAHPTVLPNGLPSLPATDGKNYGEADLRSTPFTVVTFFSSTCPCQAFHDGRLNQLASTYAPQGVRFVVVDSNYTSTLEADGREAQARKYPMPILSDPQGAWADAFGAQYATFSVVLDAAGRVRYRGGFDSEKNSPHAEVTPFLGNALAALVSGKEPAQVETRVLGCSLVRW